MKIAIIGAYCTKFGEHWDKSLKDLLAESQLGALRDAQLTPAHIDAIYTSNMCSGLLSGQLHLAGMATEILNVHCPSFSVQGACGSGGLAIRTGIQAIESESAQVVLINGVEKMTDANSNQITTALMSAADEELEHFVGATFPGLNAMIANLYMHTYHLTREQLAMVSVANHKQGTQNPLAHFQREVTVEQVLNAPMVADPLTVFDCAPVSDGGASLIICSQDFLESYKTKYPDKKIVYIIGSGHATDTLALNQRETLTEFKANQIACEKALEMAQVTQEEIDLLELHDGFSITQIISLEDLGFFPKGCGIDFLKTTNKLIINPSGGLKAKGHPVGATGVSQAYEVAMRLRGDKVKTGLPGEALAKTGMTHNMGGCGTTSTVHIFTKEKNV